MFKFAKGACECNMFHVLQAVLDYYILLHGSAVQSSLAAKHSERSTLALIIKLKFNFN